LRERTRKKKEWDDAHLPKLGSKRLREFVNVTDCGKAVLEKDGLEALRKCSAKDLVLLLSEDNATSIDTSINFSQAPLNARVFNDIFKTKEDVKHFGLLGKAELWIPKSSATHFDDRNLFKDDKNQKERGGSEYLSFSVRPQSSGV